MKRYTIQCFFTIVFFVNSIYAGFKWSQLEPLTFNDGKQMVRVSEYFKNEQQIALGDWDNDSDLDIIMFEVIGDSSAPETRKHRFFFVENVGTPKKHSFKKRELFKNVTSAYTK